MKFTRAIMLVVCLFNTLEAQSPAVTPNDSLSRYFTFDDDSPFGFLSTYFPPLLIQNGAELKSFITDTIFRTIRQRYGDLRAIDAIFIRSMCLTGNNTAMALFISTIATMDHRLVGVKNPVFQLFFPLTNESKEEFLRRTAALPSRFYPDATPGSDRDKLQHFFGSAFFSYIFESRQSSERIGDFIEEGEEMFIIGGTRDVRDRRANRQGQEFGLALLSDHHRIPSDFLKLVYAHHMTDSTQVHNTTTTKQGDR